MKKTVKKLIAVAGAVAMLGCSAGALAACGNGKGNSIDLTKPKAGEEHKVTYNMFTSVMPSNWNMLTYEDNNDTQIMNYLSSPFTEFDFEFDEDKGGKFKDGKINTDAIVKDGFNTVYSAATKFEDVTDEAAEAYGYTEEEVEAGGYAWKVTLRQDLKWDDGTPIKADDFIYSMKEQLAPEFQNYRASVYYGATNIINAKSYVYQGQKGWFGGTILYDDGAYTDALDDKLIFTLGSTAENKAYGGATCQLRGDLGADTSTERSKIVNALVQNGCGTADEINSLEGKTIAEIKADADLTARFNNISKLYGASLDSAPEIALYLTVIEGEFPEVDFEDVGFYKAGEYEFVVCYSQQSNFLKDDGTLSYLAAYELSSMPLVKKDLYESCKKAPSTGSTLWTTNYNTTLKTTASWGPYKLTAFQSGKSYVLEKNEYWYGWDLDQYKDQYLVDKINCYKISATDTQWMAFLKGALDDIGIDVTHADDYGNSKYAAYTPGSYTFSWHLNANIDTLKTSGRNNGILAIEDFRKALSLSIDRDAYAKELTTAYQACYGFLNSTYYYDPVNNGIYREEDVAKEALLRAYGYTENNGKWSLPGTASITDLDLEAAYATLNGYNPAQAKQYLNSAIAELKANAADYGYDASKNIEIKFGTSESTDSARQEFNYIQGIIDELTKGSELEGKIKLVFDSSYGSDWSNKFRAGEFELCTSAWGGATFNPCYLIGAYVDPDSMYTTYWNTAEDMITVYLPEYANITNEDFGIEAGTITVSLLEAYKSLNGVDGALYNWKSGGDLSENSRLKILGAMEERILTHYYSIPTITQWSSALLSPKFSYATEDYNTFMSYGGIQYLRVNYDDGAWYDYVKTDNKGNLMNEYKKN